MIGQYPWGHGDADPHCRIKRVRTRVFRGGLRQIMMTSCGAAAFGLVAIDEAGDGTVYTYEREDELEL